VCLVVPQGALLTVRLTVSEGLRAAARFWMVAPDHRPLMRWELSPGVSGDVEKRLGIPPETLDGHSLSFALHLCAGDPRVERGRVAVHVHQGEEECVVLPPTRFDRNRVPRCVEDGPELIEDGFVFLLKS